jgi:hypothetical protein
VIAGLPTDAESWSNVAANGAQILALAVAGWWTYTRFVRGRQPFPRATVELVISHRQLDAQHAFLRVVAKVNNVGTALLATQELRADVYQVLPVHPDTAAKLTGESLVKNDAREADWHCIGSRIGRLPAQIEPGEWDEFGFDFVIPAGVATVFIYTYIQNVTQRHRELGWTVTKLYDLEDESGEARERTETASMRL